jgi:hypothetical protein
MFDFTRITLLVTFGALAACSGTATPEAADKNAAAVRSSEAIDPNAKLVGTWAFDLEASDVAAPLRAECASKGAGEAACWSAVRDEASHEKIRFAGTEKGKTVWSSLLVERGEEVVLVEVPLEMSADGSSRLLAKVAGKATGVHAERFGKSPAQSIRIELVDEHTIAMLDPEKGRLVFTKR